MSTVVPIPSSTKPSTSTVVRPLPCVGKGVTVVSKAGIPVADLLRMSGSLGSPDALKYLQCGEPQDRTSPCTDPQWDAMFGPSTPHPASEEPLPVEMNILLSGFEDPKNVQECIVTRFSNQQGAEQRSLYFLHLATDAETVKLLTEGGDYKIFASTATEAPAPTSVAAAGTPFVTLPVPVAGDTVPASCATTGPTTVSMGEVVRSQPSPPEDDGTFVGRLQDLDTHILGGTNVFFYTIGELTPGELPQTAGIVIHNAAKRMDKKIKHEPEVDDTAFMHVVKREHCIFIVKSIQEVPDGVRAALSKGSVIVTLRGCEKHKSWISMELGRFERSRQLTKLGAAAHSDEVNAGKGCGGCSAVYCIGCVAACIVIELVLAV